MENVFQTQKRTVGSGAGTKLGRPGDYTLPPPAQDGDGFGGGGGWQGSGCYAGADGGEKGDGAVRARTAATQAPELKPTDWAKLTRNNSNRCLFSLLVVRPRTFTNYIVCPRT